MPDSLSDVSGNTNQDFKIGKGRIIQDGTHLTFIATGEAVLPCVQAAEELEKEHGINCTVVSMHTIKPLDSTLIMNIAANGKPIITVEEHSIYGGLGEAVGSLLLQNGFHNQFKIVGLPDDIRFQVLKQRFLSITAYQRKD